MPDWFKSPRLRLERGKEHIVDLDKKTRAFFETKPYVRVVEPDSNGVYQLHKLRFTKSLPDDLTLVTTDAVENLRSTLDQACVASAKASGITKPQNAYFPFVGDAAQLKSKLAGKSKDIPDEIKSLLCRFQPYKGGNDLLWALNKLANRSKHDMLAPTIVTCQDRALAGIAFDGELPVLGVPQWDRSKQEVILLKSKMSSNIHYYGHVTFNIAFDEVEIVGGQPAIAVLNDLASIVERILLAIETETRRLWPF